MLLRWHNLYTLALYGYIVMAEDRKGVLDRLEDKIQDEGNSRKIRSKLENTLDSVPPGPLDNLGEGSAVGVAGYFAISTGQTAVLPIPGIRQPGYHVISHGMSEEGEYERHTVRINAASRDVAEFAAKYDVASPSNIDFLTSETEIVSIEEITQRPTLSTWEIIVDVADRGQKDQ